MALVPLNPAAHTFPLGRRDLHDQQLERAHYEQRVLAKIAAEEKRAASTAPPCAFDAADVVKVVTLDGDRVPLPRALFRESALGHMLDSAATWQEVQNKEIHLTTWSSDAVRTVCAWLREGSGARAVTVEATDDPATIVDVARLSHYWGPPASVLHTAALNRIGRAIDEDNAASILILAEELGARGLYELALSCVLARLGRIMHTEHWATMPSGTRNKLMTLQATHASPGGRVCHQLDFSCAAVRADARLQPYAPPPAATCPTTCNHMPHRLQPYAPPPATICPTACNHRYALPATSWSWRGGRRPSQMTPRRCLTCCVRPSPT
jgi:hypothetical protein